MPDKREEEGSPELRKLLGQILSKRAITTVFQPIVSLRDGSVLGYEALSRGPEGTPLQNPDALFGVAAESGKLWELEQLCRTRALESSIRNGPGIKLFLNVNPSTIHDEKFKRGFTQEYLDRYSIDPENIYFEITEHSAVTDLEGFRKTIEHYKQQNYKIAIDDAGAGYSGLNLITDIHPHFIKLDMKLIRDIDKDGYKKALVRSLQEFCRLANVSLIAEGVETRAELGTLIDIGVHYAQGFFIRRPEEDVRPLGDRLLESIRSLNAQRNHLYHRNLPNVYIGNLCCVNPTVAPEDIAEKVYDLFLKNSLLSAVVVEKEGVVRGMVTRTLIDHVMSGQFGYSLHARRPILKLMDRRPLTVDHDMPIDIVSNQAMSRPAQSLYDLIIVTRDGRYEGVVTIKDLLEKTMEIEVSNAKHQNPLSGLPGNLMIEHTLEKCVESDDPFTALYIDIDNFKAFNDVYGFESGDNVIRFMADLLTRVVPKEGFIGHVGGDDFVAVLPMLHVEAVCGEIIHSFDEGVVRFYSDADLKRGYIVAKNRKGEEEQFPVMSLSVSGVTNESRRFSNIYQLAECASQIKKKCKRVWCSCCFIE